ncbi:sulfotransferase family protein [Formosa sp. PL04]|uniref:sulfotransferase family protein n=1 Tax=Formosa sp. PL04 TaxID=3081755 RepID=UPI0029812817|nr:sulfotransferase family protein [Formosa sp. PL04]MDW5290738.1 sulfotransferase family protein [Formosa sp. PL04]
MRHYRKHIVILGSARSGTSWFSELIALQHRYRLLFEPEHEFNTKEGKLICDRLLTSETSTPSCDTYLNQVFANRVDSDWIGQVSNRTWKRHLWPFIPKKYIIKFVRCNLSAQYLAEQFNIPVVFILRNPYDVIASQQRVKFPWLYDLSWFKSQEELCDLLLKNYGFNLRNQHHLSDLDALCIRWCIENAVPLLHSDQAKFEIYKYEDFRDNINLFIDFCSRHDLKPLEDLSIKFTHPSSKTHPNSTIITGHKKQSPFTQEEFKRINTYLDLFKIDFYERQTGI